MLHNSKDRERYRIHDVDQRSRYERLVEAKAEYEAAVKSYLELTPIPVAK